MYEVEKEILKNIEDKHGVNYKLKVENLHIDKKRLAMFASICDKKDAGLKNMIKELETSNTIIYQLDKIIERIRKYNPVGDIEKGSFGEVFTPFWLINEKLDKLDNNVWSNEKLKWLFPSNGIGNYAIIVVKRLMIGLENKIPNENIRYKHIIEKMIYVCELQVKNMFLWMVSIDPKSKLKLNLFRGSFLSSEFDQHMKNVWKTDRFNICPENPPYNDEFKEDNNRPKTLYNLFVEKSIKICDQVLMITPSRWLSGGFGLDNFREMMFNRSDIKLIKHYNDATKIFGSKVEIKGGVSYFLIDKNYNGECNFNDNYCKLNKYDIFVEPKYHILLNKIISDNTLSQICKAQSYFGFPGNESLFTNTEQLDSLKVYVSKNKGLIMWVNKNILDTNKIKGFKVFTPGAAGSTNDLGKFGNKIIGYPNEVCSKSYMTLLVKSEEEAKYLISYMNTNFCNFFLSLRKKTQNLKPDSLKWIPLVPFDREWNDELLYKHFNLTQEEIDLIENK